MLIRDNYRQSFYDIIKKDHVLLVASDDVDSLCACFIFMHLLQCDETPFTLVPVSGWDGVQRALNDYTEKDGAIVMINCGGNRSLHDFNLPDQCSIFIIDSRRPFHHENVFDGANIRILVDSAELNELRIPSMQDVIKEDGEGEESESEEDEGESNDRPDIIERVQRRAIRRQGKVQWERRKNELLWKYYESAWHSLSTSVRMLELAASLNRGTAELMWVAAIGLNSQFTDRLITLDAYTTICCDRMRPFIQKYAPRNAGKADDLLRISFGRELPLALYPWWSLYSSMMVNEHFACKTKNWTQKGDSDVKKLLSNLGLTIVETKQKFESMPTDRRKEVVGILEAAMDSTFASFVAHLGYCNRICAADVARGIAAKLETPRKIAVVERFHNALDALRKFTSVAGVEPDIMPITKTLDNYKAGLERVWSTVAMAMNQGEVLSTGSIYLYSSSRQLHDDILESRHFLMTFSWFLLNAFAASRRGRSSKALIVCFPLAGDRQGWTLVTGLMPMAFAYEDSNLKSMIGRAFERVHDMSGMEMQRNFFDTNIVGIRMEDRSRFIECLQAVVEST